MKPMVVCKHRVEVEGEIFCQKHKKFIKHPYQCSKEECKDCSFPALAMITIPVGRCDECPFHYTHYTRGAGCADDYFCEAAGGRRIARYIEYTDEIPPVPDWCPYFIKEAEEFMEEINT